MTNREGMWFGVLMSHRDKLVASAFSTRKESLEQQLVQISRVFSERYLKVAESRLVEQLADLFEGKRVQSSVKLDSARVSDFRRRVCSVLSQIPRGKVTTYGDISHALDSSPRAVGGAVGSNPWALFVPCHRVVTSTRLIGEYSMNGKHSHESSLVKRGILEREGVRFIQDRVESSTVWKPGGAAE